MGIPNIIALVTGIALFLFGMNLMGDSLKQVAGHKLEVILWRLSRTPLKGILFGALVTAAVQSSSATTIMVVGFVNSGMMQLAQAIGVIMGANIGTSITEWILCLSLIGGNSSPLLQLLSISTLTAALGVIGIILRMFCKTPTKKHVGEILLGFAVLMFGMATMSGSVSVLRDNPAFTQAEWEKLSAALPDCLIRWDVPVGDTCFDSGAEEVDLTELSLSVSQLQDLFERFPDTRFTYLVPLMGGRYAPDTQALDLRGAPLDAEALAEGLSLLDQVTKIDLRGQPASAETIDAFRTAWPDIRFLFTCDVPVGALTTEYRVMRVRGSYDDLKAYLAFAGCLPALKRIDARAVELTGEQVDELRSSEFADRMDYNVPAFGRQIPNGTTELNLDGVAIASVEEVEECLARLPGLKRISMCDCGLSEAEMGQLFDAHPEVKFIWWIEFGKYRLRTDATAFTTNLWEGNLYHYNSKTFAPLRYCTDLMMLDLGHNEITSLANFRGLKKLRVLILADNQITDISPLQDMEDLEYVELFLNYIRDVSPLMGKEKLVDLNMFYNQLRGSCDALKSMTSLKRLWVGTCHLSEAQLAELREALPGTLIVAEGHSSTGNGWRNHPHYNTLVQMYATGEYIPFSE